MSIGRFLLHYERISQAQNIVPKMRRFILDLAIRGKLVPQDPRDEPSTELLKHVANDDRVQANLPNGWLRARVGAALTFQYGKSLKRSERLSEGPVPVYGSNGVVGFTLKPLTIQPSVIVGRKGSAGALSLCLGPSWTTDVAYFVEAPTYFEIRYLLNVLAALNLAELGKGVKPGLSRSDAYEKVICIPPVAEQQRIVAKLDELSALCDELDAARIERDLARDRLVTVCFSRLSSPAAGTSSFADDVRFSIKNFGVLTARCANVKSMRRAILNLAARGKLIRQSVEDESALESLKRTADKRARLTEAGEIRRAKLLEPVRPDEQPFEVPPNWEWCRIGDAVLFTQYGTSQKARIGVDGVPVLTMGNIQNGLVVLGREKCLPVSSDELPALYLKKFDLLYNRTNSAELVGKTGIYLGESDARTFASYLIRLRTAHDDVCPHYLNLAMNCPEFRETQIVPLIKKQTGQANVNGTALRNMIIPLPPITEQRRIVARVDELFSLCDQLVASLENSDDTRRRLLDSLLTEAVRSAEREAAA